MSISAFHPIRPCWTYVKSNFWSTPQAPLVEAAIQGSACSSQQLQSSLKSTAHALGPKDGGGAGCIPGPHRGLQPSETPKHQGFVWNILSDIHGISLVFPGYVWNLPNSKSSLYLWLSRVRWVIKPLMFLRCKFLHWQHEEFSQEKCEFILKEGKPTSNGLSPLFPKKTGAFVVPVLDKHSLRDFATQ